MHLRVYARMHVRAQTHTLRYPCRLQALKEHSAQLFDQLRGQMTVVPDAQQQQQKRRKSVTFKQQA